MYTSARCTLQLTAVSLLLLAACSQGGAPPVAHLSRATLDASGGGLTASETIPGGALAQQNPFAIGGGAALSAFSDGGGAGGGSGALVLDHPFPMLAGATGGRGGAATGGGGGAATASASGGGGAGGTYAAQAFTADVTGLSLPPSGH